MTWRFIPAAVMAAAFQVAAVDINIELEPQLLELNGNFIIQNGGVVRLNGQQPIAAAPSKPDPAGEHTLELTDGSTLHGKLVSLGKNGLVWKRSDASDPITFQPTDVLRIVLSKESPIADADTNATLKLTGGDWLTGKMNTFADGKFSIEPGSGSPPLLVDRSMVEWMVLSPTPPDAFEGPRGPVGLAGWEPNVPRSWDYAEDSLIARQSSAISRRFAVLPERMDIQFTAGDGGNQNRGLTLWIQSEGRTTGYSEGSVYLRFQGNSVIVNSYDGREMKNNSINFEQDNTKLDKVSRYRLLFDRTSGRLQVRINGNRAAEWTLPMPQKTAPGGTLTFQPSYWSSDFAWTLSNVKIQPWDGDSVPDGDPDEVGKDILKSAPTVRKSGTFEGLTADAVRFSGKDISRKDAIFLRLGRKPTEAANPAVARVWLARRGEFDVFGIGYKDGVFKARTTFAGDIALPTTALRAIEFPHRQGALAADPELPIDTLVFKNGDQLKGTLISAANDQQLRWKPANGNAEIRFETTQLAGVRLMPHDTAPQRPTGGVAVRWANGDWLPGTLLGLDGDKLTMRTVLSEKTEIARHGLTALYFSPSEEPSVWDGACEREKWLEGAVAPGFWNPNRNDKSAVRKTSPWAYFDGSFTLPATARNSNGVNLGRSFDTLPDKCEISFILSSPSGTASVVSHLFFDDNKPGYMIQSAGDFAYLYDMSPRAGRVIGNQQQQVEFGSAAGESNTQRQFTFYCDRSKGRFHMAVNGKLVGTLQQKGAKESPKPGRGISIIPQDNGASVTISQIWIGPWTGALPPTAEKSKKTATLVDGTNPAEATGEKKTSLPPSPPESAVAGDFIALANGDESRGTVKRVTAESIVLDCDVGEVEIPTIRATVLQFAPTPTATIAGARLRLAGKGTISVERFRIENGVIHCVSPHAGAFELPLTKIRELILAPNAHGPFERNETAQPGSAFQL